MKLTGTNLTLTLPVVALKKIGHIRTSENVNRFLEEKMEQLNVPNKEIVKEYGANVVLVENLIINMIEKNITFSESIERSKESFPALIEMFEYVIERSLLDPKFFDMIFGSVSDFVNTLSPEELKNMKNKFNVTFKCISWQFSLNIRDSGLLDIAKYFSKKSELEIMWDKFMKPIEKTVIDLLSPIAEGDEELLYELRETLDSSFDELFTTFILQTILSCVIEEAINKNITFKQAAANFDKDSLLPKVVNELSSYENLPNMENILKALIETTES